MTLPYHEPYFGLDWERAKTEEEMYLAWLDDYRDEGDVYCCNPIKSVRITRDGEWFVVTYIIDECDEHTFDYYNLAIEEIGRTKSLEMTKKMAFRFVCTYLEEIKPRSTT